MINKKQKPTTPTTPTKETYQSSNPRLKKNTKSLMNYVNQWISSIKK